MNGIKLGLVAILAIVTASGLALVPVPASAGQNVTSSQNAKPDPLRIARGAKSWAENCGLCHNLRDPKEFSDKNWEIIVNHMRTLAPLPGEMAQDIKAFLKESN